MEIKLGGDFPWPLPDSGMRIEIIPTTDGTGLDALFIVGHPSPSIEDERAFKEHHLRFGIVPFPPLVFILLVAHGGWMFDAPFGIGLHDIEFVKRFLSCSKESHGWPKAARVIVTLVLVDSKTRIVRNIKRVTLTRAWWIKLADAFALCPTTFSREAYTEAINRANLKWPTTDAMMEACTIVEQGGI